MQSTFQPSWRGDVKRTKLKGKAMWGSSLEEQKIDQSISYQKEGRQNQSNSATTISDLDTLRGISKIQQIIGVPGKTTKDVNPLENMRALPLAGQGNDLHTATIFNMSKKQSVKHRRKEIAKGKKRNEGVQAVYKQIRGENKQRIGSTGHTGQSMALQVVNRTANMAKIAGESHLNRRKSYGDLLAKVQKAEEGSNGGKIGPPDLPIELPRGRLLTTHVFLLGRKMNVEVLRMGRDVIKYEVTDDEMRTYSVETTERHLYNCLSKEQQAEILVVPVDTKIVMLIGRLGFRVNETDKRKKELAIIESKVEAEEKTIKSSKKWGKIKKLTTDIGEDMFQRRINADAKDVASVVGLGMLKAKQGKDYEALVLFIQAVRAANLVHLKSDTGNHTLIPGALNNSKNEVFGARFWNTMAKIAFNTYLDDLRIQVLNVALDCSEIAAGFIENLANQQLWILRGRIHESLGHLQPASDLYEHCISKFTHGKDLHEVMFRAAAVAKRLGRFTRCVAYMEFSLLKTPPGFAQKDILFQISRVHEQEGKVDVASDGFKQAFQFVRNKTGSTAMSKEPRSWREWINRQETWDKEAERSFDTGYYGIAIDMIQRSLMLGDKRVQFELQKPFGGESDKLLLEASKRWWMAAVSARHLGELHTSLKACEEAVKADPSNVLASTALKKWKNFFLHNGEADIKDPDMMMDGKTWMTAKYEGNCTSDGLKHAMEKQTQAALRMDNLTTTGHQKTKTKITKRKKASLRRLSVAGGKTLGAAAAATTAANLDIANKIKNNHIELDENIIMTDEEDARRLARKRGGRGGNRRRRPMSAPSPPKNTTTIVLRRLEELQQSKEMKKKQLKESRQKNKHLETLVASALRRLVIMGNQAIKQLQADGSTNKNKFGFAPTSPHALVATLLLNDKSLLPATIQSQNFIQSVDLICGQIDSTVLLSPARPNLKELRTQQRSPSAKSMSLSMLSPNGNRRSTITNQSVQRNDSASAERLFCGRTSSNDYAFLNNVASGATTNNTGSDGKGGLYRKKKLDHVVEKAILSHSLSNNLYQGSSKGSSKRRSNKRQGKSRGSNGGTGRNGSDNNFMRLTRVGGSTGTASRAKMQRRWKRERPRQTHCRKNRRNWFEEHLEYEKHKPAIVVMEDGKNRLMKDPILMSRIGSIVSKLNRTICGKTLESS